MSAPVQPTIADRLVASLRLIIRGELPQLTYCGTYEYAIQSVNGTAVSAAPTDTTLPLPTIANMPVRPSVLGESVGGIQTGQTCLVQFINANPSRPVITSLSAISNTATIDAENSVSIGASSIAVALAGGSAPVARIGDMITVFLPTSPVAITGVLKGPGGPFFFNGTITFTSPATGMMTAGSPSVSA